MRNLLLIFAVLAAACGTPEFVASTTTSTTSSIATPSQLGELEAARSAWASASASDYTLTETCTGCKPRTVAVRDGEVASLTDDEALTVDDVFATIEESIRQGAIVEVEYHTELGYPIRLIIDFEGDGIIDVDISFDDLEEMKIVETLDELLDAQEKWEARHLHSYRYIGRFDCTCEEEGTYEVTVRDRTTVEVVPLEESASEAISPGNIDDLFTDLAEWFTDSADLIDDGILAIDVRMDPEFGYPRWFKVEAEDIDTDGFAGRFTITVTIDLVELLDDSITRETIDDLAAAEAAFALWLTAGLTDYSFTLTQHCECPREVSGPFEITVVDGAFQSATLMPDGSSISGFDLFAMTLDETFLVIIGAITAGTDVDVTYDETLGYPALAIIDPEAVSVDGGLAFSIDDVQPTDD